MEIKRDAYLQQLTHKSFTVIISFTKRVKAVIKVKQIDTYWNVSKINF